jgi:hypothetical protein
MMVGRAEHWAFRQMLYRLRGQQGTVWLPSFNRDIELSQDRLATDSYLNIKKIGYAYTGGVIDGRQHILIDGTYPVQVSGLGAEPSPAEEHLNLLAAAGTPLSAGTFGSFMDTCRLASDDIEIMHHTDTDGAAECNLSFKSFRDPRAVPAIISYPIPASAKGVDFCGTPAPEEADCVNVDAGYWGYIHVDTSQGPDLSVMRPTWTFTLRRGGVDQAVVISSDNYTDWDGGLEPYPASLPYDYLYGYTVYFFTPASAIPRGEAGWATDPFIDGPPDTLRVNIIQYLYSNYIFPDGGDHGTQYATVVIPQLGFTSTVQIYDIIGLWPQGPGDFAI